MKVGTLSGKNRHFRDFLANLVLFACTYGLSLGVVAGLKYTPAEPAGVVPSVTGVNPPAGSVDDQLVEAENMEALLDARPEPFARQQRTSGNMRMVPDTTGFEELKLRWEKHFGGVRPDGYNEVISRRSECSILTVKVSGASSDSRPGPCAPRSQNSPAPCVSVQNRYC